MAKVILHSGAGSASPQTVVCVNGISALSGDPPHVLCMGTSMAKRPIPGPIVISFDGADGQETLIEQTVEGAIRSVRKLERQGARAILVGGSERDVLPAEVWLIAVAASAA